MGYAEDYQAIDEHFKYKKMVYGEWLFFAFGMEPNCVTSDYLSKMAYDINIPCETINEQVEKAVIPEIFHKKKMRQFAYELLESGECIFRMSEAHRRSQR